jgi:7-cyano-7-deazaguanine reductase
VATTDRSSAFVALGHAGSDSYAGLESFPNPGVDSVELVSDELTALCPITGQPDLYRLTIVYRPVERCLESKSLKLAVRIRDEVAAALDLPAERVSICLEQKARGGITISARV